MPAYAGKPYKDTTTGVLIYQRPSSAKGTFYFRFPLPGGGKWHEGNTKISGAVTDPCMPPSDAIAVAVAEWNRVQQQIAAGATVTKCHTVKDATQKRIEELDEAFKQGTVKKDYHKNRTGFLRNYVLPYAPFAKMNINSFDEPALEAFSNNILTGRTVAESTVDKWGIYLGEVFDKAIALKWLPKKERPVTKLVVDSRSLKAAETNPRFTEAEWKAMEAAIPAFLKAPYLSEYDEKLRRLVVLMAEVCYAYGLRVGELIRLQWQYAREHVEGNRTFYVLDVPTPLKGHQAHIRTTLPLEWWEARVKVILETELPAYFSDCGLERKGLLFQRPNGEPADNLANVFDKWLETANVVSNFGKHSFTSFRHTWINEMIERTSIGDGTIADLAGTSTEILRKHYRKAFAIRQIENERKQRSLMKMLEETHNANKAKEEANGEQEINMAPANIPKDFTPDMKFLLDE